MTNTTPVYTDTRADAKWPDVAQLMFDGVASKIDADRLETAAKRGVYRGGSSGLVLPDGSTTGGCLRAAAARFLGAEPPRDPAEWMHKQLMFEHGYTNEDSWFDNLKRSGWNGLILREQEFSIKWQIDGVNGTGREDLVLCDAVGSPQCLLELKAVCSLSTAQTVLLKAQPKLEHAIQLGTYMRHTGLPGVIAYTSRTDIAVPDWGFLKKLLPAGPNDTGHHAYGYCVWSAGGRNGPQVTKLNQFVTRYKFRWRDDRLEWSTFESPLEKWLTTPITGAGIDEYYRATTRMLADRKLAAPHKPLDIDGSKATYKPCSYCSWQPICDAAGDDYEAWHSAVKQRADDAIADLPTK